MNLTIRALMRALLVCFLPILLCCQQRTQNTRTRQRLELNATSHPDQPVSYKSAQITPDNLLLAYPPEEYTYEERNIDDIKDFLAINTPDLKVSPGQTAFIIHFKGATQTSTNSSVSLSLSAAAPSSQSNTSTKPKPVNTNHTIANAPEISEPEKHEVPKSNNNVTPQLRRNSSPSRSITRPKGTPIPQPKGADTLDGSSPKTTAQNSKGTSPGSTALKPDLPEREGVAAVIPTSLEESPVSKTSGDANQRIAILRGRIGRLPANLRLALAEEDALRAPAIEKAERKMSSIGQDWPAFAMRRVGNFETWEAYQKEFLKDPTTQRVYAPLKKSATGQVRELDESNISLEKGAYFAAYSSELYRVINGFDRASGSKAARAASVARNLSGMKDDDGASALVSDMKKQMGLKPEDPLPPDNDNRWTIVGEKIADLSTGAQHLIDALPKAERGTPNYRGFRLDANGRVPDWEGPTDSTSSTRSSALKPEGMFNGSAGTTKHGIGSDFAIAVDLSLSEKPTNRAGKAVGSAFGSAEAEFLHEKGQKLVNVRPPFLDISEVGSNIGGLTRPADFKPQIKSGGGMETQKEANARWSQHLQQKFDQWTPGKSPEEIAAAKPGLTAVQNVLSSSMERNGGREYWGGNVVIFLTGGD